MPPRRAPLPRLLALAALLGLALLSGCRSEEPLEIPFFYEHEPQEDRTDDAIPILFSGWERIPEKDETRVHVLWPLFHYVREGREKQVSFLGVPVASERIDHRGFPDVDYILGPVFYGHSADEGTYLSVLPLGGTLKGILGKDYSLMVLPPLFMYLREKDWKSYHVMFPFVNWWDGGGRRGFRIFPFYAHYERDTAGGRLSFRRTWVLWPFWQTLENNIDSAAGAQSMWFLFPFGGKSTGPDTSRWTVMYPFVSYYENRGSSFGGPLYDVRAPWPFVRIMRGRDRSLTDIWPFFGVKERRVPFDIGSGQDTYARRFILWPFWRDEQQTLLDTRYDRWWLMPFLWSFSTENQLTGRMKREVKVWPLFRYKRWPDGRVAVNVFSPLWFQDPEGAFERIYGPFTRVWHEWRDDEGARRWELLWGLCGRREYEMRDGTDVGRTSVLFGLFQYERRGERKGLRFFYLPPWPTWGDDAEPRERAPDPYGPGRGGQRTPG